MKAYYRVEESLDEVQDEQPASFTETISTNLVLVSDDDLQELPTENLQELPKVGNSDVDGLQDLPAMGNSDVDDLQELGTVANSDVGQSKVQDLEENPPELDDESDDWGSYLSLSIYVQMEENQDCLVMFNVFRMAVNITLWN